jgi:hypothetical protein
MLSVHLSLRSMNIVDTSISNFKHFKVNSTAKFLVYAVPLLANRQNVQEVHCAEECP